MPQKRPPSPIVGSPRTRVNSNGGFTERLGATGTGPNSLNTESNSMPIFWPRKLLRGTVGWVPQPKVLLSRWRVRRHPAAKTPPSKLGGASRNSLSHKVGAPGFEPGTSCSRSPARHG